MGYSPWGHKELDTTEQLHVDFDFVLIFMITLIAQLVKNLPAMQETPVRFLGQEDPLETG